MKRLLFFNMLLLITSAVFGQMTFNYASPQQYTKNVAITTLSATKSGSVTPAVTLNKVTTLYGNGTAGDANGPTAADVRFQAPMGIAFDADGNMYIVEDTNGKRIRKITASGEVSVLAGPATGGATGTTNATGAAARFTTPLDAAIHPITGDIYITDANCVRKITQAGEVTTFAGISGTAGYVDGEPSAARFRYLAGITIDKDGNIYLADRDNHCIRKYTASTNLFTTLAGIGNATANATAGYADGNGTAAKFNKPVQIALDAAGNIFVSDRTNFRIRKITPAGEVTTYAGDGTNVYKEGNGTAAGFVDPYGIVVAQDGSIYVGDYNGNRIRKIDPDKNVTTIAGNGTAGFIDNVGAAARVAQASGITIGPNGNLYFLGRQGSLRTITVAGYTITPALPAGLALDALTGDISGTSTEVSAQTTYTVNAYNGNGELEATTTLELSVIDGALPVTLKSFEAKKQTNGNVNITWATASEYNNSHFILSKSTDGTNFTALIQKASLGNQGGNYNFVDANVNNRANYYKLVQIDKDGTSKELGVKVINGGISAANNWKVYPNPMNKECSVYLPSAKVGQSQTINIYATNGTLLHSAILKVNNTNNINIKLPANLNSGIYMMEIKGFGTKKIMVK